MTRTVHKRAIAEAPSMDAVALPKSEITASERRLLGSIGERVSELKFEDKTFESRAFKERELHYLLPLKDFLKQIDIDDVSSKVITQRYFKKSLVPLMADLVSQMTGETSTLNFTTARLRTSFREGKRKTYLELKGPKGVSGSSSVERNERSVRIKDFKLIRDLKALATKGFAEKTRYKVKGTVTGPDGDKVKVVAQIDVFSKAGIKGKNACQLGLRSPFVLVDVELGKRSLISSMRQGKHSFEFLKSAIELSALNKEQQQLFSAKQIATRGITRQFLREFQKLFPEQK